MYVIHVSKLRVLLISPPEEDNPLQPSAAMQPLHAAVQPEQFGPSEMRKCPEEPLAPMPQ